MLKSYEINIIIKRLIPNCISLREIDGLSIFKEYDKNCVVYLTEVNENFSLYDRVICYVIRFPRDISMDNLIKLVKSECNLFLCGILLGAK